MIFQATATCHATLPSRNRTVSLVAVRRKHYYACLHEQIQRGVQVLVIAFAFTSILLPLVLSSLIEHAAGMYSAVWGAAVSLVALQLLGTGWVVLQKQAITGGRYERYIGALPLGFLQKTVINARILIEANAVLGLLWLAGLAVIFIEAGAPHPRTTFLLRVAAVTGSVLAVQYSWLWGRSQRLMIASAVAFDAALIAALHPPANSGKVEISTTILLLIAAVAAAVLLMLINSSTRAASLAKRVWPTKRHNLARRRERSLRFRTHLLVALAAFYRAALLHALRGELALRVLAAFAACTIAVLLSAFHTSDSWALVFWFAGATLSANALASLEVPLREVHAASRQYFGALPLSATSARLADAVVLSILAVIVAAVFATAGSLMVPTHVYGWFSGVGAALIVAIGQLAIGARFPRQVVVLTFLPDAAVVAAFGWLWS